MGDLEFIENTLRKTADSVGACSTKALSYEDFKGYLAEADMVAHNAIVSSIKSIYPADGIYSEEGDKSGSVEDPASVARTWILDPICGTTNYLRGIPLFVHSMCVMDSEGVLASGIYCPSLKEIFLADRARVWLNGNPVRVSNVSRLAEAVVAVNCNQSDEQHGSEKLKRLIDVFAPPATRRVKIFESANLEMAYVACGRLDGYVNPDDKAWDIAAGSLMISSAGGSVTIFQGSLKDYTACRGVVAGNGYLKQSLESKLEKWSENI